LTVRFWAGTNNPEVEPKRAKTNWLLGNDCCDYSIILQFVPDQWRCSADLHLETGEKIRLQVGKKISAQRHGNETRATSSEGNARTVAGNQRGNCERLAERNCGEGRVLLYDFTEGNGNDFERAWMRNIDQHSGPLSYYPLASAFHHDAEVFQRSIQPTTKP
jgi:hypothetical protein